MKLNHEIARATRFAIVLIIATVSSSISYAQTFPDWFKARVDLSNARYQQAKNAKGIAHQAESPSGDSRSTSLVDETSASDFVSVAANLLPVSSGTTEPTSSPSTNSTSSTSGSGTATVSLYGILAAVNKAGIVNPGFYKAHVTARRFSFTAGTAASVQATDNTTTPSTVLGGKFLIINGRELFNTRNSGILSRINVNTLASALASTQLEIVRDIQQQLFPAQDTIEEKKAFADSLGSDFESTTLPKLSADTVKGIDALIDSRLPVVYDALQTQIDTAYDDIGKAAQMSLAYTGNVRTGAGYNSHRGELLYDYGMSKTINWTVNASVDFTDRKGAATSSTGGRFATEFQYTLIEPPSVSAQSPLVFSFGGEGDWLSKQKPQYSGQIKLSIPLVAGVSFPIAYRYENHAAQLNTSNSSAILGLSFDLGALGKALK